MRKITKIIITAFLAGYTERLDNSYTNGHELYLHDNMIARKCIGGILITTAGWPSMTTKERLNAIPGVQVCQKNHELYLNNDKWDGAWTKIPE